MLTVTIGLMVGAAIVFVFGFLSARNAAEMKAKERLDLRERATKVDREKPSRSEENLNALTGVGRDLMAGGPGQKLR